ncbi:hypothetical protein ACFWBG_30245 [Nocardia salmonicida]|uniref:hypothetical protein n=1 Tax=Nocardia salmonicida TaxID=53431 RepID=UPI00366C257D
MALRDLLHDPARAPVLVVGTLWRAYYTELCRPHAAQARDLLDNTATVLEVPSSFHDADPRTLSAVAGSDPRLALATQRGDGRITQYLAGGPELVRRFERELTVSARAIVQVALDARRIGHRNAIAQSILAAAAYAYMAPSEWHAVAAESDWFERGLAEAVRPCKGADGPLTRIVPVPLRSRTDRPAGADLSPDASAAEPLYPLADYLDQYGRGHRAQQIPPIPFWEAASLHAHSHDLTLLGSAAWNRGLYRDAAQLWLNATRRGDIAAATKLV